MRRPLPLLAIAATLALVAAACTGPVLANPPVAHPLSTAAPSTAPRPADPQPIVLPRDDAPHDRLTEWWYDTGHLVDETGAHWGFEFVVFRAERGGFPVSWASHLALTDEAGQRFQYAQRAEIGPQVNVATGATPGFDLAIRGLNPADPSTFTRAPWTMRGASGDDHLAATALPAEALGDPSGGFGLDLTLHATKPAALHNGDGFVDFGPAGGSYYYSRTSMAAAGTLSVGAKTLRVTGSAWFDHQWGDFISVGGGGWDWYAINLGDGTDVTLSMVRAVDGTYPLVYGTLVSPSGSARRLSEDDFVVSVTKHWSSPRTGITYPAGWTVAIPSAGIVAHLTPSVPQQELDTWATTGVVYWEGSQRVAATVDGRAVTGQAYVELTGYAPTK
ncbi:MAG TPA: lipocalin family protein [Candidatus Limnocylindrales bacterium]